MKMEEELRRQEYKTKQKTSIKIRSHGNVNEEKNRGLEFLRRRIYVTTRRKTKQKDKVLDILQTLNELQALNFDKINTHVKK